MNPPPSRLEDEQFRTPLFDAMVNLAESRKVSFHTPGHKSGKGISTRFRKFVGPRVFSIDLTTLDEVDSLQNPTGVIKEAQELAAKSAGADRSYFLVNGTTVGNHAMVASTTGPGDKVLIGVADLVLKNVRVNDLFARWGGEEFMIMVTNSALDNARMSAEKLRLLIEQHVFPGDIRVTCSFGVAQYLADENEDRFIQRVDDALYLAKARGRNRLETA